MPNDRLRIALSPELLQHLATRSPAEGRKHGTIINRDLARYYFLLDRARVRVRELFAAAEIAARGTGLGSPLERGWTRPGPETARPGHLALFALLDAVERFWAHPAETTDPDGSTRLDFRTVFADPQPASATRRGSSLVPYQLSIDGWIEPS
jgi:hypothetical protein